MLEECVSKEIYYREVKQRVFLDSRAWIPAINFRDPDKRVEEVFTIFERVDLTKEEEEERVGLHTQVWPWLRTICFIPFPSSPFIKHAERIVEVGEPVGDHSLP